MSVPPHCSKVYKCAFVVRACRIIRPCVCVEVEQCGVVCVRIGIMVDLICCLSGRLQRQFM